MTRAAAISRALDMVDDGSFAETLRRRVAMPTASREPDRVPDLWAYAEAELAPCFARMGFRTRIFRHEAAPGPFLLAERIENPRLTTVLQYGHGDVVSGLEDKWNQGLSPFALSERDGRWYGRGTADNKGQHSVNIAAAEALLAVRGSLGFNLKYLIEMGEESGSPGLDAFCAEHADDLAADVFIGSDGPRLALDRPTIFLGARGGISFEVSIEARKDFQHSGNWGGILANPGIELCHAVAALVDRRGRIKVPALTPGAIPDNVRHALQDCRIAPEPGDPPVDVWWGEPGLTTAEKVFAWSSFEVMEFECGNLAQPLYAIPPRARARLQLRFPVGVDPDAVVPAVRQALLDDGFDRVVVKDPTDLVFRASRLDPDHYWVRRVADSIRRSVGSAPAILPNLGGSLPNNVFCDGLGLPTIWIPHSYPGCLQHGPNEHLPISVAREGLAVMAGLYWDLGDAPED